jgi:putative hemolysin
MNFNGLSWMVIGLCLVLSFAMSGMETGVFALNRFRLRRRQRAGDAAARQLLRYLEEPESFLWIILAGHAVANFFGVALLASELYAWLGARPLVFWCAFGWSAVLLYVLSDLLPKRLFQLYPERLCLALARPFGLVQVGLSPLVSFITWFSRGMLRWTGGQVFTGRLFANRDELRILMRESGQNLSTEEKSMIDRVMDFQKLTVKHAMQPLDKTVRIPASMPLAQVLSLCRERSLTRLIVEKDGTSRIIGLISLRNILYRENMDPGKTAGDFVKSALFLQEDLYLESALRRMQRSGQRLAIVLGPDRREAGIISLQDVLRAIFGEVNL